MVRIVSLMCRYKWNWVRLNGRFNDDFQFRQDCKRVQCLALLFALEPWSGEMKWRCSEELFYAEDLVSLSNSIVDSKGKLDASKRTPNSKKLIVNVKKMKMIMSSERTRKIKKNGKLSCAVCWKGKGILPCSASSASSMCIKDVAILEVGWSWMMRLNVEIPQIRKQKQKRKAQA